MPEYFEKCSTGPLNHWHKHQIIVATFKVTTLLAIIPSANPNSEFVTHEKVGFYFDLLDMERYFYKI
jgi:hypothetical protein